jgi:hypothetical protein
VTLSAKVVLAAMVLLAPLLLTSLTNVPATATPSLTPGYFATSIANPSGISTSTPSLENAVSCPPTGPCVAVGDVEPTLGNYVGTASIADPSGAFVQSVEISLPSAAYSVLNGVSCAASGDCTAVGVGALGGVGEAIAATMTGGAIGSAIMVMPPANFDAAGTAQLSGVACTAPGACVAVGSYATSSTSVSSMIAIESGGAFARAVEVAPPLLDLTDSGGLYGISCGTPTTCFAVGSFISLSAGEVPMTVEISSGAPDLAQQAPLPGGATSGRLVAVSCPSGTACQAVGFANTAAGSVPLVDTAANGAFVTATELPSAPNQTSASSEQEDLLSGIQCTSTGNCVIAGNYENSYLGEQAFVIDESGGTYAPASPVGSSSLATFGVSGVACGSAGACTLVATETPAATQLPEAAQVREVERATATLTTNATGQSSYNYNQSISDTATLSGGSASPGGTLVFLVFAPTDSTCSANPVNGANPVTVTGDGNFNAPTTSPTQGPGTYSWVVLYTGDANNNPVLSPCHSPNEESDVHLAMTPESDLQEAYLGEIYPSYVQAYGNSSPFSYSITSGSLPDGLTFAPNTVTAGFAGYPDDPSQAGQTFTFTVAVTDVNGATGSATYSITVAGLPHGYWLVGSDGGIFTFGDAGFYGSTGALTLQRPVVGITPTFDFGGYWLVASDGGIFTFGDGGFYGSIPGLGLQPAGSGKAHSLNAPIVGMVPSIDGGGYFMVAADGGVFAFGDATYAGSCPSIGGLFRRGGGGHARRQRERVLAGDQDGPRLHLWRCDLLRSTGSRCRSGHLVPEHA